MYNYYINTYNLRLAFISTIFLYISQEIRPYKARKFNLLVSLSCLCVKVNFRNIS